MSYASVYAKKPPSAKGIGLTIGLHVAVVAGIMALPAITAIIERKGEITAIHIPIKPDPVQPKTELDEPIVQLPKLIKPQTVVPTITKPTILTDPVNYGLEGAANGTMSGGIAGGYDFPVAAIEITPDPVVIGVKLNARFSKQFQPDYPTGLLRLGAEGLVSVRVLVGINGRAKKIELIDTPRDGFWAATRRHALKKWRFKPATKDSKPYESWITLKVKFTINS